MVKLKEKKSAKRNWIAIISIVLNIILLSVLAGIIVKYPAKLKRIFEIEGQRDIVMLGNSLTSGVAWTELLGRRDVANKGMGGQTTQQFIDRIDSVIRLQPKICFVEGGLNDLHQGFSDEKIIENLRIIIDTLQANNIKPILSTVSYITRKRSMMNNGRVNSVNELILNLAEEKNITILDLNRILSEADGDFLNEDYARNDGIHLNAKGNAVWKDEVIKILSEEGF